MAEVGIIMGSQSDWPTMKDAALVLDERVHHAVAPGAQLAEVLGVGAVGPLEEVDDAEEGTGGRGEAGDESDGEQRVTHVGNSPRGKEAGGNVTRFSPARINAAKPQTVPSSA